MEKNKFSEKHQGMSQLTNIRFDRRKIWGKQQCCDSIFLCSQIIPSEEILGSHH